MPAGRGATRLSALDDNCPHQGGALSEDAVVGDQIRCLGRGWTVGTDGWRDQAAGACRHTPVEARGGTIFVRIRLR